MGYKRGELLKTAFETYSIQSQRGSGGSGEVYEVTDADGSRFAAKILDHSRATPSRLRRFKNEINFCSKNTHKNIVPVLGSGVSEKGATFYVMPLYSGTLRDLITDGLKPEAVLRYYGQILDGVEAAHLLGVWHRDLKPENVLYSRADDALVVADFGIAHFEEEELLTIVETGHHERLANFMYSAPEQRTRGQGVNSKADVYAVGLILNEMFSGQVPQGTAFKTVLESAPDYGYLDGIIELMLRQEAAMRPTIDDVKQQLIARGNEFMAAQRLNLTKSQVIPESEIDDPFIRNPIKIIGADYQNGWITYKLSAAPLPDWMMAFRDSRRSFSSYLGKGPETFTLNGSAVQVPLNERGGETLEQMTNYVKMYVANANQRYAEIVTAKHKENIAAQKAAQQRAILQAEERQKMLARIAELKF